MDPSLMGMIRLFVVISVYTKEIRTFIELKLISFLVVITDAVCGSDQTEISQLLLEITSTSFMP